jgi:phosphoribosylformimino-5-aminoimidazole carboxamide ribonucleotide (ProFAR) isomerase
MIVLPAIDIQGGHAVRLRQGVESDSTKYFDDPVEAALQWAEGGAQFLHVVDLDGAFTGSRCNAQVIGKICDAVDIPVEVGGGIRSEEAITALTLNGAAAVDRADRIGSLEAGKQADLVILQYPSYKFLPYHTGVNIVETVVKNGKVVHQNA